MNDLSREKLSQNQDAGPLCGTGNFIIFSNQIGLQASAGFLALVAGQEPSNVIGIGSYDSSDAFV